MTLKYFHNLAYDEIGEENNEIILFLHSKLLGKWIWKKQKEDYKKYFNGFHCIFLDLPNHGDSKSEGDFSIKKASMEIKEFVKDLIETKRKKTLKRNKINLVASGLGASISIEIINKNPHLINNLIFSGLEIANFKESKSNSVINRLAKTQSEYLNEKPDTFIIKAYLRHYGISKEYFDDVEKILERSIKEEEKIAFESLNYTIPKSLIDNKRLLEKENMLIIFANKEDLNCTQSAIGLKSLFKNAKLIEIDKGKHLWNIIDNELFNTIIANFIKFNYIEKNSKINILE
ncbi:alpha/beta fold hydrolase [Methanobrevibacter olleyae]|uniref:Hydrolase alpha/beta fold family n=1 Tax=Methanobrevibacter olleyae TaxID=294671 RepID=A0A126QZT7_METOL|nr:alpha/beta hydrolase [Methanobrevibacter olleyae]AMK15561.1 hydrolase alpha/beta fold family [Methanobrevibacter olleyae]SFL78014.1 Pimeloyl-ACP methyl ester carboxylesterase [Methanobrevibacter olleyae]